jgi:hypothetical protein
MNKKLLTILLVLGSGMCMAQQKGEKEIALGKALSAFGVGASLNGLHFMQTVHSIDPTDADVNSLYRLQANRFAFELAEDCDMEPGLSNCDSALKYVEIARQLGDSSVLHEVLAMALYNKLSALQERDFNAHRESMPERLLSPEIGYRYIPEERKLFFKELISRTLVEVRIARGDFEKRDKVKILHNKLTAIEKATELVGME